MHSRPFASESTSVSEIGLGTWQFGGEWGEMPQVEGLAILYAAISAGVRFFDTADVYGKGVSEEIVGMFMEACPDDVFLATKCGRFPEPGWPENFRRETMRQHATASRDRLKVEALDLLQLHCIPREELERGEVFDHLRSLRDEGIIRRFGASVETVEEGMLCLQQEGLSSLQVIFNLFRQEPADELFPAAREKGVAIIVRLPLASGLLADKFDAGSTFAEQDHRHFNRDGQAFHVGETFAGLPFEQGLDCVRQLREFVPAGMDMKSLALRWILDHEEVTTVIPGASNADQAIANAGVSAIARLPGEVHERLGRFFRETVSPLVRGRR